VWRDLANVWPGPFLRHLAQPSAQLVAHTGVAGMAAALWDELGPHISDFRGDIQVAGHSLGGSLATLLAGHASLKLGIGERLYCSSFGSPPVLALDNGPGGSNLPAALGIPAAHCRNFVCDQDVVPRMFLAADPAFSTLQSLPGASALLSLRERVFGASVSFSSSRFLYHAAGQVFLLRWDGERGFSATPVDPGEAHKQLALEGGKNALQLARSILDHHCGSYSSALHSAAASLALGGKKGA
jgi:pimeloyl-ACP methyl ester carboxylesterase